MIIDQKIYHLGASLKDLGKNGFAFSKMDNSVAKLILEQLKKRWQYEQMSLNNNDLADLYDLMINQGNPEIIKTKVQTIIFEQLKGGGNMKWEKVEFGELYLLPSKNGLNRPSRVRGSGYKMINMGELFAFDRIKDIPMELVPMNDRN